MNNKYNFFEKAKKVHNDKYNYSKVEYKGTHSKVCIICPIHGEFFQTPHNHIKGCGCPKCSAIKNGKKLSLTTEEFIKRAKAIHGDKYDYSKVKYVNSHSKVCIIDPEYGEFWQTPDSHLKGGGHPLGMGKKVWDKRQRLTTEEFVKRAKLVHGDKYDYSKVEYINAKTKICVICPKHGEFWIKPFNLLNKNGCCECSKEKSSKRQRLTTEEFVKRAKLVHGDKYDYSKVEYVNNHTNICIIDPEYGEFWQSPSTHLKGCGHPLGKGKKVWDKRGRTTTDLFVVKARKIHGDKYDYSKVNYTTCDTKICIVCPKHGEFWQTPENHLQGKGCSFCSMSHLENEIMNYLILKKIDFKYNCGNTELPWIKRQHLDFYLPKYNVGIECQGEQHFKPIAFGSKNKTPQQCLNSVIERDKRKYKLCKQNGVKLFYYSNLNIEYPYNVYENKENMINDIING